MTCQIFLFADKRSTDRQCYDFDPTTDELFETTKKILRLLDPKQIDQYGNTYVSEELLKLLHVFILPEILFHKKDLHYIEPVLQEIEKQTEKIENEIQSKDRTKRNTENSLWKQRQDLLRTENFGSEKYVSSLEEKFLHVLLKHIEKDLVKLNEIFVKTDEQIRPLRNSTSEREVKTLTKARQEQKEVFSVIEQFTTAREEIRNVIRRDHVKKIFRKARGNLTDFHLIYMEVNLRLEKICAEIWDLINRKIKLSGVREAASLTIKEIKSDGSSYGYNRKKGAFEREIDLFDASKKPEAWTTLEEKVKSCLCVKQLGFKKDFIKFCERIRTKCEQVKDESKLFSNNGLNSPVEPISPSTAEFVDRIGRESVNRRTSCTANSGARSSLPSGTKEEEVQMRKQASYTSRWSMSPVPQNACDSICHEAKEHMAEMSRRLAVELQSNSKEQIPQMFVNKVYVCYEQHVSEELIPVLCELYEDSYRQQCFSLSHWIENYSSDLGMEPVMKGLFQFSSSSSAESSTDELSDTEVKIPMEQTESLSLKSCTLSSRDLKKMHLDELYERMNKQHQSLDESFDGALDIGLEPCMPPGLELGTPNPVYINPLGEVGDNSVECERSNETLMKSEGAGERPKLNGQLLQGELYMQDGAFKDELPVLNLNPPPYSEINNNLLAANSEVQMRNRNRSEAPPPYSTLPPLKQQFYEAFDEFFDYVHKEDKACSLFDKLGVLTEALHYVSAQISSLRAKGVDEPCADDLLDVIILLLCKLETDWLLKLYAHLNLMIQLLPHFMVGNAHEYSLVKMTMAYQFLFDQQMLHKNAQRF